MLRIKKFRLVDIIYIWIKFIICMVFVHLFQLKIWNQFLLIFFFICVWCIENWLFSWLWNHEMFYFFILNEFTAHQFRNFYGWINWMCIICVCSLSVKHEIVHSLCFSTNHSDWLIYQQFQRLCFSRNTEQKKFTFYILHDYFVDISS